MCDCSFHTIRNPSACHQHITSSTDQYTDLYLFSGPSIVRLPLILSSFLCLSFLSLSRQRTRRLHRPQESRTRRGPAGEPRWPQPSRHRLRKGPHGHMGPREPTRHPAHPSHTGESRWKMSQLSIFFIYFIFFIRRGCNLSRKTAATCIECG